MERRCLLLLGDFTPPEFAPVAERLRGQCNVATVPDVAAALRHLAESDGSAEAIILAYPSPGAFSAEALARLREAAPLAHQLAVLGTWCEGESRSGRPPAGVIRTCWHQWVPRWADEFLDSSSASPPGWALPETVADEDRLLHLADRRWPLGRGLVILATPQYEMADLLGSACRKRGYSTVWLSPSAPPRTIGAAAILWDGSGDEIERLAAFCRSEAGGTPVVALLDFPRQREIAPAMAAGVAAVLAKPLLLEDLFWHLDRITADHDAVRRVA